MEGEYCDLSNVVRVCKTYGAYVYLDEAHSIGAMGATGRGLSEYTGTDTSDIDIMMGTFTKSFGGMGGYIAADKETIDFLRLKCSGSVYHNALSPVVCQQVLAAFKVSVVLQVVPINCLSVRVFGIYHCHIVQVYLTYPIHHLLYSR